jgi:hypothetical protein
MMKTSSVGADWLEQGVLIDLGVDRDGDTFLEVLARVG